MRRLACLGADQRPELRKRGGAAPVGTQAGYLSICSRMLGSINNGMHYGLGCFTDAALKAFHESSGLGWRAPAVCCRLKESGNQSRPAGSVGTGSGRDPGSQRTHVTALVFLSTPQQCQFGLGLLSVSPSVHIDTQEVSKRLRSPPAEPEGYAATYLDGSAFVKHFMSDLALTEQPTRL